MLYTLGEEVKARKGQTISEVQNTQRLNKAFESFLLRNSYPDTYFKLDVKQITY